MGQAIRMSRLEVWARTDIVVLQWNWWNCFFRDTSVPQLRPLNRLDRPTSIIQDNLIYVNSLTVDVLHICKIAAQQHLGESVIK